MPSKSECQRVADHYSHGRLLDVIRQGILESGKSPEAVTVHDLAPVDEFHIGGRQATESFVGQLKLKSEYHVLDVGCGIGGTSRFVASEFQCRVTGIDQTPEFIDVGQILCQWVGLADRIELHQGTATDMPFAAEEFDVAYMLHVGMNIADKQALFGEVHRVIRPGATFGMFDVMLTGNDKLTYPVPWANSSDISSVATPEEYRQTLLECGFEVLREQNRREFALKFFERLRQQSQSDDGPPKLSIQILMGSDAPVKVRNMVENVTAGRVAPVEMIARKRRS